MGTGHTFPIHELVVLLSFVLQLEDSDECYKLNPIDVIQGGGG